jgi:hypothetical protein
MKKIKSKKLKKRDVGRFVRIAFEDVGAVDGVITEVLDAYDFRFLPLHGFADCSAPNNGAPVIALGRWVTAELSGL